MKRRVVITGVSALTGAGVGAAPLWDAALAQRSTIRPIERFPIDGFPVRIAAEIPGFHPHAYIPRKTLKVMARDIQLAVAASKLAVEDAGLELGRINPERIGITMGSGLLSYELEELGPPIATGLDSDAAFHLDKFGAEGLHRLFPLWLLKYLPNMPACHVSILLNLQGPSNSITMGCASALEAIGEAFRIIERGAADLMLTGGAESKVNPIGLTRYQLMGILAQRSDRPEAAYRPFDADRDGLVVGEGAGILVLEELEHARQRGATIYAEVIGYGSAPSVTRPPYEEIDEQGCRWAMERALGDARRASQAVSYVHAHGIGTQAGDASEARAIAAVFGAKPATVVATKPLMGYAGYASGALDLVIAALSVSAQRMVGTMNCDQPDPALPVRIHRATEAAAVQSVLVNNAGLGGANASMVLNVL